MPVIHPSAAILAELSITEQIEQNRSKMQALGISPEESARYANLYFANLVLQSQNRRIQRLAH